MNVNSRILKMAGAALRRFLGDRGGSAMVMFPSFILVAAGIASLAVDMGHLYGLRGKLQHTADAAVLAAVGDLPDEDAARATAIDLATKNMSVAEHGTVLAEADVVTGNWDAGTRTFTPAGDPVNAIRVVTRRSEANGNAAGLFFARVLGFDEVDMETSAIASSQVGDACVIALDPSVPDALKVSGNAVVTLGCGAQVNSTDTKAVRVGGGSACLTALSISVAGDAQGNCINPTADTDMEQMDDPLDYLEPPEDNGCDYNTLVEVTVDTILSPGVYCGGIDINGGPIVDFLPGEYILKGAGLSITGNGTVTGDEVMFYVDPTTTGILPDALQSVHLAGTADITLSAPTSGDYEDVLFYQDASSPPDLIAVFNGSADTALNGVLYFPNNPVRFSGNGDPGGATSIVARTVTFTGNANLGSNPATKTFGPGGANGISLVQ